LVSLTPKMSGKIEPQEFTFPDIEAGKTYTLTLDAVSGYEILGLTLRCDTGTAIVTCSIESTPITGAENITATSSRIVVSTIVQSSPFVDL